MLQRRDFHETVKLAPQPFPSGGAIDQIVIAARISLGNRFGISENTTHVQGVQWQNYVSNVSRASKIET